LRHHDITQAIGNTPLVHLSRLSPDGYRIWLKLEGMNPTGSIKDRVALAMVEAAEAAGDLHPGARILEPTSGNTGIALAAIARTRGYELTCVMPSNTSEERRQLLRLFGADIVESPAQQGSNGAVLLARELAADDPDVVMLFQYGNPANPGAHAASTAAEILADLPTVGAFVAGLGTGGTVTGVGRRLKAHDPGIRVYAAEPQYGDLVYGLRNLDEGYVPEVLDADVLDSRIKVDSRKALGWTRRIVAEEGIFAGVSTGAAVAVAARVCERLPVGTDVVAMSPDGGWKYLSTGAYDVGDVDDLAAEIEDTLWA
jgi:cysteine synthase